MNSVDWREQRQHLKMMALKYPGALIDVIDSAYLAGLEADAKNRQKRIFTSVSSQ